MDGGRAGNFTACRKVESTVKGRKSNKRIDLVHHEQTKSAQTSFQTDVNSPIAVMEKIGNPFLEESDELLALDSKAIADTKVVDTVRKMEHLGQFAKERLIERSKSSFAPIKKNKLPLFKSPPSRNVSTERQKISSLKSDCSLFGRLYIACQT